MKNDNPSKLVMSSVLDSNTCAQDVLNVIYAIASGYGVKFSSTSPGFKKGHSALMMNTAAHWRKTTFTVILVNKNPATNTNKFWSIEKNSMTSDNLIIRWGRIGTAGSNQEVVINHPEYIQSEHLKLIRKLNDKLKDGYSFHSAEILCERAFTEVVLAPRGDVLLCGEIVRYIGLDDKHSPEMCSLMDSQYNILALAPTEGISEIF
jgi:hypothetical protein